MKLLEKLAEDAFQESRDKPEYNLCCGCEEDFKSAYAAGFCKARELMVAQITAEIGEAGLPTVGCDPQLGEAEAP